MELELELCRVRPLAEVRDAVGDRTEQGQDRLRARVGQGGAVREEDVVLWVVLPVVLPVLRKRCAMHNSPFKQC